MKLVYEASVYPASDLTANWIGLDKFLSDEGVSLWDSDTDKDSEVLPEVAGRLCYLSFKNPRPGGNAAYLKHILDSGHGSVLEHAVFGFIFTGISRSLSHELVRHRAGFGYSQLSQRYVDESDVAFVVPPELQEEVRSGQVYTTMHGKTASDLLALIQENKDGGWSGVPETDRVGLSWLSRREGDLEEYREEAEYMIRKIKPQKIKCEQCLGRGGWEDPEEGQFVTHADCHGTGEVDEPKTDIRKRARQTARNCLSNCTETKIFVTGNARAWRHFIEQRGSRHAEAEIRHLAYKVWTVLVKEAPNLFSDYAWTMKSDGRPVDVSTPYEKV